MLVPNDLNQFSVAMAIQLSEAQHIATQAAPQTPAQLQHRFEEKMTAFDGVLDSDTYLSTAVTELFQKILK